MVEDRVQIEMALGDVSTAGAALDAAKQAHSATATPHAERELQRVIDRARNLDIPWGQIGLALGIARGCAYQRYRRRPLDREPRRVA